MKASRPPKNIDLFLKESGFGIDKKTNYYLSRIQESELVISIHFGVNEIYKNLYNICLALNYPVSDNSIVMNPPEVDSIKPNGHLSMTEDFTDQIDELWDFEKTSINILKNTINNCIELILNSKLMLNLFKYLIGEDNKLPNEFKSSICSNFVQKKTPNRLFMMAMYQVLNSDYDKAIASINEMPEWMIGEYENKVIEDAKLNEIIIPISNVEYMESIGAGYLDFKQAN